MNIFKKILAPKEVKQVLAALAAAESEFDSQELYVLLVRRRIEQMVLIEQERTIHSIVVDKITPMNVAFILITNVTGEYLSSGQYHVYRGVLNFAGESLLRIFDTATEKLVASGYHSPEEAEKDKAWVRKQIAEVG